MSLSKDKALCFRKGGTTYTYYGYTTPPSGHYIGFRSGGVTRYVPLANNTNGGLKVRVAGGTYSVTKQTATVTVTCSMQAVQIMVSRWAVTSAVTKVSTDKAFNENATVYIAVGYTGNLYYAEGTYTLNAESTSINPSISTGSKTATGSSVASSVSVRITVFGKTFQGAKSYQGSLSTTITFQIPIEVDYLS